MPVLDSAKTMKRLMDDAEFVSELYATFLETLAERIERIRILTQEGDVKPLLAEAHSLKGASGTINAEFLEASALALENAARNGDTQEMLSQLKRVEEEAENVDKAIREWIAAHPPAS